MTGVQLIKGTGDLRAVAAKLKEAGRKDITAAMVRGIKRSTKEAVEDTKNVVRKLPIQGHGSGGGLRGGSNARFLHDVARSKSKNLGHTIERALGRSGLRESVARAITTTVSTSPRRASVRVKVNRSAMPVGQRKLPKLLNRGKWRHPVYGNKNAWVEQTSEPDWFDGTLGKHAPAIREAIATSIDEVVAKLD